MGGWATAQSPILVTTITLDRLRKRGYQALLTYYEKVAPHLKTRRVRDPYARWCERCPVSLMAHGHLLDWQLVFIHIRLFVIYLAFIFLSLTIFTNLSTKHKFILFFLSVGNPKTVLKGGYSGWRGGSSFITSTIFIFFR